MRGHLSPLLFLVASLMPLNSATVQGTARFVVEIPEERNVGDDVDLIEPNLIGNSDSNLMETVSFTSEDYSEGPTESAEPSMAPSMEPSLPPQKRIMSASASINCVDDKSWIYIVGSVENGDLSTRTCYAIARNPDARCDTRVGVDGRKASEACRLSCDTCDSGSVISLPSSSPSATPSYSREPSSSPSSTPSYSREPSSSPSSSPSYSLQPTPPLDACSGGDSTTWTYFLADGRIQTCADISVNPSELCSIFGTNGQRAVEACQGTCGCDLCQTSTGDQNVGVFAYYDESCDKRDLGPGEHGSGGHPIYDYIGCFDNVCRHCKVFETPQSSHLIDCPFSVAATISLPSSAPSYSKAPSNQPSNKPSTSAEPSATPSFMPSFSKLPSSQPSRSPSFSSIPSNAPSLQPSVSNEPSKTPSFSEAPSETPSTSVEPSGTPSFSAEPSSSPTECPEDDPSWHFFFPDGSEHYCDDVARFPELLCFIFGVDQKPASEACAGACLACRISSSPSSFPSFSEEPSASPSFSQSPSASPSMSLEPSASPSLSSEPSSSPSVSSEPTMTPELGNVITSEPTKSDQPSASPSVSSEPSKSPSFSLAPSKAPSHSQTPSRSPSVSLEPSSTPSYSVEPSKSPSNSPSQSQSPSKSPSVSSKPSATPSVSLEPSKLPSYSLEPSKSPSYSVEPSKSPSNSPSQSQSPSSTPSFSSEPSATPSQSPSVSIEPTGTPEIPQLQTAHPTASTQPSSSPSVSSAPSSNPSVSSAPSKTPSFSMEPSKTPSRTPSFSSSPSSVPSYSVEPSSTPSVSIEPSSTPSFSQEPSASPSRSPSYSQEPSASPSRSPSYSQEPSASPSRSPSYSQEPSASPSRSPSFSQEPSSTPSVSSEPSGTPSSSPSVSNVPTEGFPIAESCSNLYRYFRTPSTESTETTKGFAVEFVPKREMQLVDVELHLANRADILVEIHIKEGTFGIGGGYTELYSGTVDGNGRGKSTDLASIKRQNSYMLEPGTKYSLYIWTNSNDSIQTRRGTQPSSTDITFTQVLRINNFSDQVDDGIDYLWSSGLLSSGYMLEGILDFCESEASVVAPDTPEPSVSISPSSSPSYSMEPSSTPSVSNEPSQSSESPSISIEPSSSPSVSMVPSSMPSISNMPSLPPIPRIEEIDICDDYIVSPSITADKRTRGFVVEFKPKKQLRITGYSLHLDANLMMLDVHIKEGVFGIGDGFVKLASGYIVGNGKGESTRVNSAMSVTPTYTLQPNTKYSLYIWTDDWIGVYTKQGTQPSNSDIEIINITRLNIYSDRVDSQGRLDESGLIFGDYLFEGGIEYCLV